MASKTTKDQTSAASPTAKAASKKAKAAPKKAKAAPKKAKAAPKKAKAAPKKAKAAPKKAKAAPKKAKAAPPTTSDVPTPAAAAPATTGTTAKAPTGTSTEPRAASSAAKAPTRPSGPPDPAVDLAQAVAALALDKKAEDVVILKVSDLTSYADCFIVASAPSERQVQAIARHVDDEMRRSGKIPAGTEGLEQGHWVLVDLGAVVLHVFLGSARSYYDLEGFWQDAPRVDVDERRGLDVLAAMKAAHEERRAQLSS